MKFNLTKPFDGAMQSVPEVDPWQGIVTFYIRPIFYGPFQRALKESRPEKPSIMQRALSRAAKKMALVLAPVAAPLAEGEVPPPQRTFEDVFREAYEETIEATPEEEFGNRSGDDSLPADVVALLVERVGGLVDEETNLPGDVGALPSLLADESIVPPGMRYAGMEAGLALRLWLVERARAAADALVPLKEAAEKNSESSCDSELVS